MTILCILNIGFIQQFRHTLLQHWVNGKQSNVIRKRLVQLRRFFPIHLYHSGGNVLLPVQLHIFLLPVGASTLKTGR